MYLHKFSFPNSENGKQKGTEGEFRLKSLNDDVIKELQTNNEHLKAPMIIVYLQSAA